MPVLLVKSLLALPLVLLALVGMFTMLEVFGRKEKRYNIGKLKVVHRWNGYLFLLLFLIVAALCIDLLARSRMPLDARTTFHVVLALLVFLLLLIKITFIRAYRLYYSQVPAYGLAIAVLGLTLVAITSGYYLIVSGFTTGPDMTGETAEAPVSGPGDASPITVPTDSASIERGMALYRQYCITCHDPESEEPAAGRGQRNILQRDKLPVSGRPATPENIERQLRQPIGTMPSFDWMSREQVRNLLAYLATF